MISRKRSKFFLAERSTPWWNPKWPNISDTKVIYSSIEQQIKSIHARGLTTRQISDRIEEIYGFKCSEGFISDVTGKIIEDWQNRPLDFICPVLFIDTVHFSVREDNRIKNLAAYVILVITLEGKKDVIGLQIGESESAKFCLSILNGLKDRGVEDILIACVDGLAGFPQSIEAVFPETGIQQCIIHQIRNTTKFVSYKELKPLMADLKRVYAALTEANALAELDSFDEKWSEKYPKIAKSWKDN